jgi:hypothetical protein
MLGDLDADEVEANSPSAPPADDLYGFTDAM